MSTPQHSTQPDGDLPSEEATSFPNDVVMEPDPAVDAATSLASDVAGVDDWQVKAQEYLSGWQRAQADYQNLQKESTARIQSSITYATESFLHELLPMVDHFDYAFQSIPAAERDSSWLKGVEYIYSNFLKVLEEHGVTRLDLIGQPFDPAVAEAVDEVEPDADHPSGTVVAQVAAGFKLHDKIIRCAKVTVAK